MAEHYYVNDTAQPNGDHEVHAQNCYWLGQARSTTYLGLFATCREAVAAARRHYRQCNGCVHCAAACHTS
ncbi:hypothetical protein [Devosia sp.]|uniref:hypothetical protein n=1 Tax=Devosia sp. TaxID=1871048 RepID=UPI002FC8E55B